MTHRQNFYTKALCGGWDLYMGINSWGRHARDVVPPNFRAIYDCWRTWPITRDGALNKNKGGAS